MLENKKTTSCSHLYISFTYEEAVKNAQEVLELLIEDNKNLPQPNIYESEVIAN